MAHKRNPSRSREHFRWDERHHQPHTDMSKWQKFWASRSDAAQFVRLLGRSARQVPPVLRAYRRLLKESPAPHSVADGAFGVAISPAPATWDRYLERILELGVASLLVRVPCWEPEPVFALRDEFARLRSQGVHFTFTLVQDRSMVREPERWGAFVRAAASCLAGLEPTFQLGHAINRKKWGVWHPEEYVRLMEEAAPVREAYPGCRWIGPPIIDFEYYFTASYLAGPRPFDFDGIASLLYVDRRGSPDAVQYRHFDLRRKILLLRAVVQASPHPDVPIHLTEFNWPLRGAGKYSPAGAHVATDEAGQARYLVLYDLTAAATGQVASTFWWQLVARGYGLLDDDERWTERRGYRAFAALLARSRGCDITALPETLRPVRGFLLRRGAQSTALLYTAGAPWRLDAALKIEEAVDLVGCPVGERPVTLGPVPVYASLGTADTDEVLSTLAQRRRQEA